MNLRTYWRVTALAGRPACRLRIRTILTGHCFCVKRQGGVRIPLAPPLMTGFWRDCFKRVNVHDVLYAHRPSFLTLRLFEQVLEEVHRTALTSRLGMLCRHVANIGNMSTQHPKARCQRRTVHFLQNLLEKAQRQERGSMRIQHIMHIDPLKAISPKPSHQWRGQGDSNPPLALHAETMPC